MPRLLLTPEEAAKSLAISLRTLQSLTSSGAIPCVRIGRAVRFDPRSLRDWISAQQAPTGQTVELMEETDGRSPV